MYACNYEMPHNFYFFKTNVHPQAHAELKFFPEIKKKKIWNAIMIFETKPKTFSERKINFRNLKKNWGETEVFKIFTNYFLSTNLISEFKKT